MNSVEYLLENGFSKLSFSSKCAVKTLGRQTPSLTLVNEIPPSERNPKGFRRKFNCRLYERYDWLTGCDKKNKLYCFPCLLFAQSKSVWTSSGYDNLSNLSNVASKHEGSTSHKASVISLKRLGTEERIDTALSEARRNAIAEHNQQVEKNRSLLCRLIDAVRYLSTHELSFRGNQEESASFNQGNYKDLLDLLAKYDETLKTHLESDPIFKGRSKTIQNDLIQSLSTSVLSTISDELKTANFVAIGVDETTDISCNTQFALTVRYVVKSSVVERFLGFTNISGKTNADSIAKLIFEKLEEFKISEKLIAQTYDGAATMAGNNTGVQRQVLDRYPAAVFIHCWAHKLNLVLQNAVSGNRDSKLFFSTVDGLHSFFSRSPKRMAVLKQHDSKIHITAPSRTRWTFKARALDNLLKNYATLLAFFNDVIDDPDNWDSETCNASQGFLSNITCMRFRFLLVVFSEIFSPAKLLFEQLQKVEGNVVNACRRLKVLSTLLINLETESSFDRSLETARELFSGDEPATKKRKTLSHDEFRTLRLEIIRSVNQHFQVRFQSLPQLMFVALVDNTKFSEFSQNFPEDLIQSLSSGVYGRFFDASILKRELSLLYNDPLLNSLPPSDLLKNIEQQDISQSYAEVLRLLQLILTLPLGTANCERSFSALKRIKTALRNKVCDKRLSSLAIIAIEKELATNVKNETVIDHFAASKDRRLVLHRR